MRSTVELAQLPYSFALNRLLMPDKFLSELRDRGVLLGRDRLEALHQLRLVVPLLRLRRDTRDIASEYRRNPREAWSLAHWQPTSRWDFNDALRDGRLFDPAEERFMSRHQLTRTLDDTTYESSVYLYSAHQLIHARLIEESLRWLQLRQKHGRFTPKLTVNPIWRRGWIEQARRLRELTVAVLALEPLYYSQVLGTLRLDSDPRARDWNTEFERYYAWRRDQPLGRPLQWLGVNSKWIADAGVELLRLADSIDPLGDWAELLPHANPERWSRLKGRARSAVDLRVAAEVALRYHDDLVEAGRATALPSHPNYRGDSHFRLKPRRSLDAALTDFGLSPHPRVVVMVEGATELLLFPRVMQVLGIRTDEDFIAVQDAGGVGRDLAPIVAYLAPRLGERQTDRYVELLRHPTRILIVLDAEGLAATKEQREARRQVWVNRLMETLPRELRRDGSIAPVIREQLDLLVDVVTWNRAGESFEFAHFTDGQIARAIDRLDPRPNKPSLEQLVSRVATFRAKGGNLGNLLFRTSKLDLADELWPLLERRLERARSGSDGRRIPIVRVLDRALKLAHEFGRGRVVLALEPRPPGASRRRR